MKTKVVYILTSSEKDLLLEQLLMSLYSLKYHNPDAETYLIVDDDTAKGITGDRCKIKEYLTEVIAIETPKAYNNMLRSRWLKTSLRKQIKGDFLFIDSDTIIVDDLSECDRWTANIAAAIDRHIPVNKNHQYFDYICDKATKTGWTFTTNDEKYFNSGVMYVKDNEYTHHFFESWNRNWQEGLKYNVFQDQPTLGKTNKEHGYPIKELSGIWNCQIMANGIKFLCESKIIHYFNAERQAERKSVFYLPSDKQLYLDIKENHFELNEDIICMIQRGRSAFASNYAIFADDQLKAIRDPFSQFVLKGYNTRRIYYLFLRMLYNLYKYIKRK